MIPFSCPHCGKFMEVADQYAGQTGPCAGCGKTVTIPAPASLPGFAPPAYGPAPGKSAGGALGTVGVILAVCVVGIFLCGGVLVALLLPAVQAAREAARRMSSMNQMKMLALGLQNYHDTYQCLPPAVVYDANGKPLYSGRVLLLPFIEHLNLYNQWKLDQPWDSPENLAVSQIDLRYFRDPSGKSGPGMTDYLFVSGPGSVFEGPQGRGMEHVTDGTSRTLALIEVKGSGIHWAEPLDWDYTQQAWPTPGNHPGGNLAATLDGAVHFLPRTMSAQDIRAYCTRAGNEPVQLP